MFSGLPCFILSNNLVSSEMHIRRPCFQAVFASKFCNYPLKTHRDSRNLWKAWDTHRRQWFNVRWYDPFFFYFMGSPRTCTRIQLKFLNENCDFTSPPMGSREKTRIDYEDKQSGERERENVACVSFCTPARRLSPLICLPKFSLPPCATRNILVPFSQIDRIGRVRSVK